MELTVRRRDLWLIVLTGTAACSSDGSSSPTSTQRAEQATPASLRTSTTTSTAPPRTAPPFFCGEFGSEVLPWVVSLDRQTGDPVWRSCAEGAPSLLPPATEFGAFGQTSFHLSSAVLVRHDSIGVGTVDAVDPASGERLWSHPATEWLPVAVAHDIVIEARGIGFTEELPGAHPADAGKASVRAVDANYKTLWQNDDVRVLVDGFPSPPITAGDYLLAVAGPSTTVFLDLETGDEVLRENGQWRAEGDLLIGTRFGVDGALFEVVTSGGTTLSLGSEFNSVGYGTGSSDLLVNRSQDAGGGPNPEIVDRATLATKWAVTGGVLADSLDGTAAIVGDSILRLVDGTDGTVLWTFDAGAYGARVADVEIGADDVLVVPTHGF